MRLAGGQNPVFGSIGAADADIGPIMAGVLVVETALIDQPVSIRRPEGAELEEFRIAGDQGAGLGIQVDHINFITGPAGGSGDVMCRLAAIGAE